MKGLTEKLRKLASGETEALLILTVERTSVFAIARRLGIRIATRRVGKGDKVRVWRLD